MKWEKIHKSMTQRIKWWNPHRKLGFESQSTQIFLKFKVFSSFLATVQRISAYFNTLLYKLFALKFLKAQSISAHFLHNFWKISRPGIPTQRWFQINTYIKITIMYAWMTLYVQSNFLFLKFLATRIGLINLFLEKLL